jgi:predicted O-linked N-acetylglucosamine transferase (SPINDLY family)
MDQLRRNSAQIDRKSVEGLLGQAIGLHQAGRLAEAHQLYDRVLSIDQNSFDALHLLGMLEAQRGDLAKARQLLNSALRLKPRSAEALINLGNVLRLQGQLEDASEIYARVLAIDSNSILALNNRGSILSALRRFDEARASFDLALKIKPDYSDALYNRGNLFINLHRPAEALADFDKAHAIEPKDAQILVARGNALMMIGHVDDAIGDFTRALTLQPGLAQALVSRAAALRRQNRLIEALADDDRALKVWPNYAEALSHRGLTLHGLNRFDEALASYQQALAVRPDFPEAQHNRARTLSALKRFGDALAAYDKALALTPDYAEAWVGRGHILTETSRYDDALGAYDRALALELNHVEAWAGRGNVFAQTARYSQAVAAYDTALALEPDHADSWVGRGNALLDQSKIDEAIVCYRRVASSKAEFHSNLIFARNFDLDATTVEQQAERARWDELHAQRFAASIRLHANDPVADRRLRIGYVSSHFRHHASAYGFGGVLLSHDPKSFEVVCYSDVLQEDDVTARFRAHAAKWHRTAGLSDDALVDLIRSDRIDILVDLVGHMRGHRLLAFARKPAPVQVTAWGEPSGTGLGAIDYLLSDPVLVPVAERAFLAEEVIDLPNFLGFWVPDPVPEPRDPPVLRRGCVTFGSFNRLAKVRDPVLRVWAAILRSLPSAHLVLKDRGLADSDQCARVHAILREEGISPGRVELLGAMSRTEHYLAYHEIDIALDPFPHTGGITTLDALWMGVPVVSWSGSTIPSRYTAAILSAAGLAEFIASDADSYVKLALAQAADVDGLCRLRAGLRSRIANSTFGDSARYTKAVETAYRQMWERWCTGAVPPSA